MEIKKMIGRMVPLVIGILIGAGLTKNKYVFGILISYIIFVIMITLFSKGITKIKESEDKKQAAKDAVVEGANDFISSTEKGNKRGEKLFDKLYPEYVFWVNMTLLFTCIAFIFFKMYIWVLVCFIGLNMFVILNQVWRKVKYLDTEEYDKHIKDKIFQARLEKRKNKILKKMGVGENGS